MPRAGDAHTAEINGQYIKGGVGRALENTAQPSHERVCAVGLHGIHHHAARPAAAQRFHQCGRQCTDKVCIAAAGFECEPQDCGEQPSREETKEAAESADTAPQGEPVGLTVEIPLDKVAVGNLTKLLDAKGNLIRKALGITDLHIEVLDDRVAFPWFAQVDADSSAAYTHFISALCEMSRNAKRVTATEKPVENEKYAFRCFLLRLGFIGSEYKAERKILLKNLTGSSAFKNGGVGHEVSE